MMIHVLFELATQQEAVGCHIIFTCSGVLACWIFLRNKRWSTSPRGSPKARLNSRDALPAMILSVETGNWWESLIHPLQHVAQDLFDPKSAQPCFSWGREANPFKSFATSLRRRAVGLSSLALLASSVRPKKPGPSWGAFLDRGESNAGVFTCNWNILAMNCQIWLTLTLSDPLFLILMTPHLALDLKIGPASSIARAIACGKILRFDRSKIGAL